MGALICCCWRMWCCECTICEKRDDWQIEAETRPGERGAGFLYKKAKSNMMWSKRYFTINNEKMYYYVERNREILKGEIVIAGANAVESTTRANTKKKFYFNISHPQCGMREFYAKSRNRRAQWINKINEISAELSNRAIFGVILKQGGISKNIWQERWCVCAGKTLDYFENATDNQSKGAIVITNATITPMKVKDKYCFEIATANPGKKGNKKYIFACTKEHDRDRWVDALRKWSSGAFNYVESSDNKPVDEDAINPVVQNASGKASYHTEDEDEAVSTPTSTSNRGQSNDLRGSMVATELCGYLMKKSPSLMKGWQKRYFKTLKNGDIVYFKSEEEANDPVMEPKGMIRLKDIIPDIGVQLNENTFEIDLQLQTKKVHLRALNTDDAIEWAQNILAWIETTK